MQDAALRASSPGYAQAGDVSEKQSACKFSAESLQHPGSPRGQPRETGKSSSPQHTQDNFARDAFKTHISAQECNRAFKFALV